MAVVIVPIFMSLYVLLPLVQFHKSVGDITYGNHIILHLLLLCVLEVWAVVSVKSIAGYI